DLVYTITEVGALSSVSTGRVPVPHPDSPVCETLVILSGTASITTGYRWGPDSAAIDSHITVGDDDGMMSGSELAVSQKIFCGMTLEFLPGSTDLTALTTLLATPEPDPASLEEWLKDYYIRDREVKPEFPDRPGAKLLIPPPRRDDQTLAHFTDWMPTKRRLAVRPDDRIYYAGANCQIFVNMEYLDEASFMTHTIDISRKPFHSVNSVRPVFFSEGKHYITGVVRFPLVASEMLRRMVQRLVKGNTLSPKRLLQMRQRYRTGTLGNGLNEAIGQMREFYAERLGGTPEEPSRQLAGFLNDVRADTMTVLVGVDDIPVAIDQQMFTLTYRDVVFTDFSTGITADSRVVEGQASFVARVYEEGVFGEEEPDYEFERIPAPQAPRIEEPPPIVVAPPAPPAPPVPQIPIPPAAEDEADIAEADDTIPTDDASQAQAAIDEPTTVPEELSAERFIKIARAFPNNGVWYLDATNITALLTDFANWIDTEAPMSKIFREDDFDLLRNANGTPKEDLILLYSAILGLVYAETLPGAKFDIEAVGTAIGDWTNSHAAIFDALNSTATQPDVVIDEAAGTDQGLIHMEVRQLRTYLNRYGYAFPASPGDWPMTGATRTAALAQFLTDVKARGPLQCLGLYYMLSHDTFDSYYQFYRTYVTDVDFDWFVDPGTPGVTNSTAFADHDALMAANVARVIDNMRRADNIAGTQTLVMKGRSAAEIGVDHSLLACMPVWHRWGPGQMRGYSVTATGGVEFGKNVAAAYNADTDYFRMMWSVAMEVYRGAQKYDDSGNEDAGGTTLHDRIEAAITVS
ncbi:hypothetical protein HN937_12620, partial [Candidatus Poribacteria bacterium]|nr:hypothetical protein [Candidatus Poribacteria bacterium]